MEDITDANYMHAKKAFKYFEIKDIGKYQELYVQSNILFPLMYLSWSLVLQKFLPALMKIS